MAITKVTTDVITDLAVTAPKLAADSVITDKIADNAVTAAKIAAGALGDQVAGITSSASATTIAGTLTSTGAITVGDGHTMGDDADDNFVLTGSAGENVIIDSAVNIILDADVGEVQFKDAGTEIGVVSMLNQNMNIESKVSDKDILFKGVDDTSDVTALTLDMSDAGTATFNHDIKLGDGGQIMLGAASGGDAQLYHSGSNAQFVNATGDTYIQNDSIVYITNADTSKNSAAFDTDGGVTLYYNNSSKLATTNDGVTFGGTVLVDGLSNYTGLEVKGAGGSRPMMQWSNTNNGDLCAIYGTEGNAMILTSGSSNTAAMTIDSSQRINMPGQPCFSAALPAVTTNGNYVVFGGEHLDVGNHYNTSNGRFTAPIAGNYFFSFWILMDPSGANHYSRILFAVNGSSSTQWTDNLENASREAQGDFHSVGGSTIIPLAANDYVQLYNSGQSPTYGTSYGNWNGFLVS